MAEWHLDVTDVICNWTEEFYNLMLAHYIERKKFENSSQEDSNSGNGKVEDLTESEVMKVIGCNSIKPYPSVSNK